MTYTVTHPRAFRADVVADLRCEIRNLGILPVEIPAETVARWEWVAQANNRTDTHNLNGKTYIVDASARWYVAL